MYTRPISPPSTKTGESRSFGLGAAGGIMTRQAAAWLGAAVILCAGVTVAAHEVTYKGTVVELRTAKYAQPNGGVREAQELDVTIVDAKTKKPAVRVFTITAATRLLRAGTRVTVAEAAIQKAEAVEVVIDHDKPGDEAIEIRLTAR